ncbi:MAG: carboxypeptidase, partial [Flavobacteriaceae bacterium]
MLFAQKRTLPVDTMVITNHTTTIKGVKVTYTADTGTQPVWDAEGNPIASLFYTYYRRTNGKTVAERPLI